MASCLESTLGGEQDRTEPDNGRQKDTQTKCLSVSSEPQNSALKKPFPTGETSA